MPKFWMMSPKRPMPITIPKKPMPITSTGKPYMPVVIDPTNRPKPKMGGNSMQQKARPAAMAAQNAKARMK